MDFDFTMKPNALFNFPHRSKKPPSAPDKYAAVSGAAAKDGNSVVNIPLALSDTATLSEEVYDG